MSTKPRMKEKKQKGWVILHNGKWIHGVSSNMSKNLREFYNRNKEYQVVPCTIHYKLPPQKK